MVAPREPIEIVTKHRTRYVDAAEADLILDTRILRLNGVRGFYGRPFLYFNRNQGVHHRFRSPYDALRSTIYKKDWEGQGDIPDGEKQRLLQYLAEHRFLLVWVASGLLSKRERERFERMCRKMGRQLGKPINEIKVQILEAILFAPQTEGEETVQLLKGIITLDQQRLDQVLQITSAVNWHALILLREITSQREVLSQAHALLVELHAEHQQLFRSTLRVAHFCRVDHLVELLTEAVDRPFRRVARKTIRDLKLYFERGGLDGNFREAGEYLTRSLVAVSNFLRQSDLEGVMLRIAHAQSYQGPKRQELLASARARLVAVEQALCPTTNEEQLTNNPYPRVRGHIADALYIWECADDEEEDRELDIDGLKESIEEAKNAL